MCLTPIIRIPNRAKDPHLTVQNPFCEQVKIKNLSLLHEQLGKSEGRDEFYSASKGWVISLWQIIGFPGYFLNKGSQVRADREQGFWEILLQSHSLEQYLWDTPHAQLQPASLPEMCWVFGRMFFLLSACSHTVDCTFLVPHNQKG